MTLNVKITKLVRRSVNILYNIAILIFYKVGWLLYIDNILYHAFAVIIIYTYILSISGAQSFHPACWMMGPGPVHRPDWPLHARIGLHAASTWPCTSESGPLPPHTIPICTMLHYTSRISPELLRMASGHLDWLFFTLIGPTHCPVAPWSALCLPALPQLVPHYTDWSCNAQISSILSHTAPISSAHPV